MVEGLTANVREFLGRMRGMSWQALQVRGQDLVRAPVQVPQATRLNAAQAAVGEHVTCTRAVAVPSHTRCATGVHEFESLRRLVAPEALPFHELPEEGGLAALGGMCRKAGLHHVFLTVMKL